LVGTKGVRGEKTAQMREGQEEGRHNSMIITPRKKKKKKKNNKATLRPNKNTGNGGRERRGKGLIHVLLRERLAEGEEKRLGTIVRRVRLRGVL